MRAKLEQDQSFKLWSRVNPAHCVFPYSTESTLEYREFDPEEMDPLDKTYYMRVPAKDYKEAIARARNVEMSKRAQAGQ